MSYLFLSCTKKKFKFCSIQHEHYTIGLAIADIAWAGHGFVYIYDHHLKHITRQDLCAGALIGCMVTIGYGTQTVGLQTVSSSESAFLTALYVPLVPVLLWLIFRKVPHFMIWIGALCAFMGLVLLTGNSLNSISLNFGQTLTLLGAIAIAMEIILIGYFAPPVDIGRVTVIQLAVASVLAFAAMPLAGEHRIPDFSWPLLIFAACSPYDIYILIA